MSNTQIATVQAPEMTSALASLGIPTTAAAQGLPSAPKKADPKPATPKPATPAVTPTKPPADDMIKRGLVNVATVIEATILGDGNVWLALAAFGEASGVAGKRDKATATLRQIADHPVEFLGHLPIDVRNKILKYVDKSAQGSEVSRSVSALTAGAVLPHYVAQVRTALAQSEGSFGAGMTRCIVNLIPPCAVARTELGKKPPQGWNGSPHVNLPEIMGRAADTEKKAQEKVAAAREASRKAAEELAKIKERDGTADTTGSAGNTGDKSDPKQNPALNPPPAGVLLKSDWGKALEGIENASKGLPKLFPDANKAAFNAELVKLQGAVSALRQLFKAADASKAKALPNPAAGLAKK